ncbi:MAG: hypothetical protein JXJ04_21570 [Spirochaetales bacterium]|nr:hypothetical protein [Spirochaetales bacterium]
MVLFVKQEDRDILLRIENREHDADLNLTANPPVIIEGSDASMFSILNQPVTPIPPTTNDVFDFSYTTFTVRFTRPSEFGNRKATMTIENDDPDENPYIINLEGSICQKRELREWVEDTQFLTSASISGDIIIAGSRMESNEGRAYIFYRNHGSTDNWGGVDSFSVENDFIVGTHLNAIYIFGYYK